MATEGQIEEKWNQIMDAARNPERSENSITEFCEVRGIDSEELAEFCMFVGTQWLEEVLEQGGIRQTDPGSLVCQAFQCGYEVAAKDFIRNPLG